MTEREAFEAWLGRRYPLADATDADDAFEAAMLECWQAACAWQRERDAEVCETSGYADAAADAIRAQGKQ